MSTDLPPPPPPPPGPPGPPPGPGPPPSGPQEPQGPYDPYRPYDPYQPPDGMPPPYGRRKSNTTVIVVIALATLVAAALVTTAIVLSPGKGDELARATRPLLIQQVIGSSAGACAAGAGGAGVPSLDGTTCYQLVPGLTITGFEKVDVVTSGTGSWAIRLYLLPPDALGFKRLTARIYQESPPRNQLAIVVDGKVVSSPAVQSPILGGTVQIEGNFTKDAAKHLADKLEG
jgi:preprotein translocase subunit SecD